MKSVGLTDEAHGKLKKYCERNDLGQGEFISAALVYFAKNGINPATHESPAAEMSRVIKRVGEVIGFIRKQESDVLRPMLEAVSTSEARIDKSLQQVATAKRLDELAGHFEKVIVDMYNVLEFLQDEAKATRSSTEKLLQDHQQKQLAALKEISDFLDKESKEGLMDKVRKKFR
jgi:hypothetical protein